MDWLLTLCVIVASVLAAKAFFRTRALTATILILKASVEVLDQRLSRFEDLPATIPDAPPAVIPLAEAPLPKETAGGSTPFAARVTAPPPLAPAGKG